MTEEEELRSKLDLTAQNLKDRITILEARDKLLRLHLERQTDIETAKATLGTCNDMCPEYERYFREESKQVSPLEMLNDKTDPYSMVKEYRRAGADQEEPLPHELRNPETLNRTMDYLCCNVMDKADDPSVCEEWYDFVWSRTRAIRKDITQQHLCDLISVSILERCTRFHIYCSVALCEMDVSHFDPKINNENLNKCIHSLKDFYSDLLLKGEFCPNESEFRGYYLLLNLRESGILREVKYFPKSIQNSRSVKFAIEVFFALSSNNFVRFFELVNEATFLEACILHRYFYHIRYQAFRILRMAYTITNQIEPYPASELISQLGFADESELTSFCEFIGLEMVNSSVMLKRGKASEGRFYSDPSRSDHLISIKKGNKSIGEIIYGKVLPLNPYKQVPLQDSFDKNGKLKQDAIIEKRRRFMGSIVPKGSELKSRLDSRFQFNTLVPRSKTEALPEIGSEIKTALIFQMMEIIFDEALRNIVIECLRKIIIEERIASLHASKILNDLIDCIVKECATLVFKEQITKKRNEIIGASMKISQEVAISILESGVNEIIKAIAKSVYYQERIILIKKQSAIACGSLIEEVISEIVRGIAKRCYKEALDNQNKLVETMKTKRSQRLARTCFNHWWLKCLKSRRFNYIKMTFPASHIENGRHKVESLKLKRKVNDVESSQKLFTDTRPYKLRNSECSLVKSITPTFHSEINLLKRKLEEERRLSEFFWQNLETFKLSLLLNEDNGEIDENNLFIK